MMRPSAASLKRVTAENLLRLGSHRLAELLVEVADTRVELKRRLRMELAAEQGAEHLLPEIDRRLTAMANSRGAISWRQRPAFTRDLDGLRGLIARRMAALDAPAARDRMLSFLRLAPRVQRRVRDREGGVEAVFARAAADAVTLLADLEPHDAGARLAAAILAQPADWSRWSVSALPDESTDLARAALAMLTGHAAPASLPVRRRLADVAQDPTAFCATFADAALRTPAVAAQVAKRFLCEGDLEAAREALERAVDPGLARDQKGGAVPDFEWETVWIAYLERAGRAQEAQEARWSSFERTLSVERAREFAKRLPDFDDVEAEQRVFEIAASWPDPSEGLRLLMEWPALREAADLIAVRGDELRPVPEAAETWARKLRRRYPAAAQRLLRRAATEAFRRRELNTSSRLSEEADAIVL